MCTCCAADPSHKANESDRSRPELWLTAQIVQLLCMKQHRTSVVQHLEGFLIS